MSDIETPVRPSQSSASGPSTTNILKPLGNIHHAAYRCRDAEQTRWFYEDIMGLRLAAAFEEEKDYGEGKVRSFLHLFFELADGNFIAFFDEPGLSTEEHFVRKDSFDAHIAFETENLEELLKWQQHINEKGKTCLGPVDHGFVSSVYMYDPNGWQIEITCKNPAYQDIMLKEANTSREELARWTEKTRPLKVEKFGAKTLDKRGR